MLGPGFRRKRNLIFKVIIAVPILWFSVIGFTVVMTGQNSAFPESLRNGERNEFVDNAGNVAGAQNDLLNVRGGQQFLENANLDNGLLKKPLQVNADQEKDYDAKLKEAMERLQGGAVPSKPAGGGANKNRFTNTRAPNLEQPKQKSDHNVLAERIHQDAAADLRRKEEERRNQRNMEQGDLLFNPAAQQAKPHYDPDAPGKLLKFLNRK